MNKKQAPAHAHHSPNSKFNSVPEGPIVPSAITAAINRREAEDTRRRREAILFEHGREADGGRGSHMAFERNPVEEAKKPDQQSSNCK